MISRNKVNLAEYVQISKNAFSRCLILLLRPLRASKNGGCVRNWGNITHVIFSLYLIFKNVHIGNTRIRIQYKNKISLETENRIYVSVLIKFIKDLISKFYKVSTWKLNSGQKWNWTNFSEVIHLGKNQARKKIFGENFRINFVCYEENKIKSTLSCCFFRGKKTCPQDKGFVN